MLVTRYAYARACACTHAHARVDTLATCVRIPCSSAVYAPPHPLHIQTHTDSMRVLTYVYCVLCVCGGGNRGPGPPGAGGGGGWLRERQAVGDECLQQRWLFGPLDWCASCPLFSSVPLVLSSPVSPRASLTSPLLSLSIPLCPLLRSLSLPVSRDLFARMSHAHARAHTHKYPRTQTT